MGQPAAFSEPDPKLAPSQTLLDSAAGTEGLTTHTAPAA